MIPENKRHHLRFNRFLETGASTPDLIPETKSQIKDSRVDSWNQIPSWKQAWGPKIPELIPENWCPHRRFQSWLLKTGVCTQDSRVDSWKQALGPRFKSWLMKTVPMNLEWWSNLTTDMQFDSGTLRRSAIKVPSCQLKGWGRNLFQSSCGIQCPSRKISPPSPSGVIAPNPNSTVGSGVKPQNFGTEDPWKPSLRSRGSRADSGTKAKGPNRQSPEFGPNQNSWAGFGVKGLGLSH